VSGGNPFALVLGRNLSWRPPPLSHGELEIEEAKPTESSEPERNDKRPKPEAQESKREPARSSEGHR